MQAVNQIPVSIEENQGQCASSKNEATHSSFRADTFYARLRRLEARLSNLENTLTAIKRDVARIDRKQYRDIQSLPAVENKQPQLTGHDLIYTA